jgi:sarcosine oxidase subunit beta
VVIGAGIQGTSVAYHLARKGLTDVVVVEMKTIGSGSSGRSAAMICHLTLSPATLALTVLSMQAYLRFEEQLGADPGYIPIGYLGLVTHSMAEELRPYYAEIQRDMGVTSQVLDRDSIDELVPGLYLDDVAFGLYTPQDGLLDPHRIYMAYAAAARRMGVAIEEGVRATGLKVNRGRLAGVETTAGLIATPCVVNAAGFGARRVAAWAGENLPITNLKRHVFVTEAVPAYRGVMPFVQDLEAEWYFRREGPGLILGMGKTPSEEEDPQVEWSFLEQVIERALYRAPLLAEARVVRGWAGLRPLTPDDDPILGPSAALEGLYHCCGWGGHGVMHAPAGGVLTAERIVDGAAVSADIAPFRVERFASG